MGAPAKFLPPGYLVFVSSRTQEGLPFVCTLYMELIIRGILARAQELFPVSVSAFLFMGNHFHLLAVIDEPELLIGFIDHVKTELAHAVNRLLGRRRHTVWCEGFDAEPILTRQDAIEKLVYLYTNPQAANLVDTLEQYLGVSSWKMFASDTLTFNSPWIQRKQVPTLSHPSVSVGEDLQLTAELRKGAKLHHTFTLTPFKWINCFGDGSRDPLVVKEEILNRIREREAGLRAKRRFPCLGAEKLRRQPIDMKYTPTKFSKRMWCICHDVGLRKTFIAWVKSLIAKGKEVLQKWRSGDRSAIYPPGLFPPSFPKLANMLPKFAFQTI